MLSPSRATVLRAGRVKKNVNAVREDRHLAVSELLATTAIAGRKVNARDAMIRSAAPSDDVGIEVPVPMADQALVPRIAPDFPRIAGREPGADAARSLPDLPQGVATKDSLRMARVRRVAGQDLAPVANPVFLGIMGLELGAGAARSSPVRRGCVVTEV